MDANPIENLDSERNAAGSFCNQQAAIGLPLDLVAKKSFVPDADGHEADACEHFTLRGFVSEYRKNDAKSCCPFTIFHNHKCDGVRACILPPLLVNKFRWWNCPNCLQKEIDPGSMKPNGAFTRIRKGEASKWIDQSSSSLKIEHSSFMGESNSKRSLIRRRKFSAASSDDDTDKDKYDAGVAVDIIQSTDMDEDLRHKKALKVRSLSDIIKSETCLPSKEAMEMNYSKLNKYEDAKNGCLDTSKGTKKNLHKQRHHINKRSRLNPAKNENEEAVRDEDGGSLMQWLNESSCRSYDRKKVTEIKCAGSTSRGATCAVSNIKCHTEVCFPQEGRHGAREHGKRSTIQVNSRKQNQSFQNENVLSKLHMACNEKKGENRLGNHDSRPSGDLPSGRNLDQPQLVGCCIEKSSKIQQEANKMTEGLEQEAFDDFPMEIVELLARKCHEKRMKDSEVTAANLHNLSKVAEFMKNHNFSDVYQAHQKGDAPGKSLPQQKATASHREGCAWIYGQPKDKFSCDAVNDRGIKNPEQAKMMCFGSKVFGQPVSLRLNEMPVPANGLRANRLKENFLWDTTVQKKRQPSRPDCISSNSKHSRYAGDSYLRVGDGVGRLRTASCEIDTRGPTTRLAPLTKRMMDLALSDSPSVAGRNGSMHETTPPLTINNKGDMPMSYFPSWMDPENSIKSINEGKGELHCPFGLQDGEDTGNTATGLDRLQGNGFKPLRPLPRLGVLGSQLREELTSRSVSWSLPFGFSPGLSNNPPSLKVDEKGGAETIGGTDLPDVHDLSFRGNSSRHPLENNPSFLAGNGAFEGRAKTKDATAVGPPCEEPCVVNRNPADFTVIDEGNKYMIRCNYPVGGSSQLVQACRSIGPRRQKKMKLTSLKGLMGS